MSDAPIRRRPGVCLLLVMALLAPACGYRVRGSVKSLPQGIASLGIPTFTNQSSTFRVEQRITAAVLKEFAARTRVPVESKSSGVDAVLYGDIRHLSTSPVTFGNDSFASAFLVTVHLSAKLVRVKDAAVLWENPNFLFRERYVINRQITEFFSEENPALDRLAREFAASLASTLVNR